MQTRRRFLGSLAALPFVSATTLTARRARAGAKVLMIGDSMIAGGFGLFLAQDLEHEDGLVVDRRGKSSTGLARPDFHDWIHVGGQARADAQPNVVVCMFGGNDGQGLYMGKSAPSEWIRYGEPEWTPEYRRRVNAFADAVTANGEQLVWIGMPQMRLERLHDRVGHMNGIYAAEMALRPNARFVEIWEVLAVDGEYSDHVVIDGKRTRVRTGDGVHITTAGAHYLADFVRPHVAERAT
jgi:hypothetical protein